jgi:hypothetical protein
MKLRAYLQCANTLNLQHKSSVGCLATGTLV